MQGLRGLVFLGALGICLGVVAAQGAEPELEGESESPRVTYKGQHFVVEKKQFSVWCTLTIFEPLKWTHNDKAIVPGEGGYTMTELPAPIGFVTSRLTVPNALMYHAGEYKCTSFSPRSHTVFVLSGDMSDIESVKIMYVGYPLSLVCNLTNNAHTALQLEWFKDNELLEANDHINVIQENSSLIMSKAKKDDVGDYKCQTKGAVATENPIFKKIKVIRVEVRKMDKSKIVTEQEDLEIICNVDATPFPKIHWMKDQERLETKVNESRITYSENKFKVPNSVLTLSKAVLEDRGNYTCVIETLAQTVEKWTFVRIKGVYAPLWPFIGIVVEVILLGVIIFIFERRRAKAEFDESDTDQGNDQKNTAHLNKDAVRHRK